MHIDIMVYIKHCETYDKNAVLEAVRQIFDACGTLEGIAGLTVAVKPNLVPRKKPECAATTHPAVVWAVCRLCREAGARVVIAESPGGFYDAGSLRATYKTCGIEEAARESGAELNFDTSETQVENPDGKYLKKLNILTPLARADRVINLAKLKTHGMMTYTGAVKNMFGAIAGLEKAEYHLQLSDYDEFADCIIDIFLAVKPVFHLIDAVVGMHKDGPTAGEPYPLGTILGGSDAFELDLAGARLIRADYRRIPVLRRAAERGLVKTEPDAISFAGDALIPAKDFVIKYNDSLKKLHFADGIFGRLLAGAIRPRPVFDRALCRGCGECVKCCPAKVIRLVPSPEGKKTKPAGRSFAQVDLSGCIRCYCCQELCPFRAVRIKRPLLNRLVIRR